MKTVARLIIEAMRKDKLIGKPITINELEDLMRKYEHPITNASARGYLRRFAENSSEIGVVGKGAIACRVPLSEQSRGSVAQVAYMITKQGAAYLPKFEAIAKARTAKNRAAGVAVRAKAQTHTKASKVKKQPWGMPITALPGETISMRGPE